MKKLMVRKGSFVLLAMVMFAITLLSGCGGGGGGTSTPPPAVPFQGNVFLDGIISQALGTTAPNYKFLHGCSSPDNTKMLVTVNKATAPQGSNAAGIAYLWMLDAAKLENGEVVSLASGTITGTSGKDNTTFRCNWSADGTKITLGAGDHLWILDATSPTLASLNGTNGDSSSFASALESAATSTYYHIHDTLPTTDGKYAIVTARTKPYTGGDASKLEGEMFLYNMQSGSYGTIGKSVKVCNSCHGQGAPKNSTLCGIDGKLEKQGDGTYTGTVFVAGHGGHFAKMALTIDPSSSTAPITVNSNDRFVISALKFPTGSINPGGTDSANSSQYKLHDGRLDGNTLYWSAYNTDVNGKVHYGKINVDGTGLVDKTIDPDPRATLPTAGSTTPVKDRMSFYCASGQTATAYFTMTMTNEAYLTVTPKSAIQ